MATIYFPPCRQMSLLTGQSPIKRNQIKSADPHQRIDDTGYPAHIAKDPCHQIKTEETDQSPVNRSDDHNRKCKTVQSFIHTDYLLLQVSVTIRTYLIPFFCPHLWQEQKSICCFYASASTAGALLISFNTKYVFVPDTPLILLMIRCSCSNDSEDCVWIFSMKS